MSLVINPIIAGNWKMNGLRASLREVEELERLLGEGPPAACQVVLCPPATLVGAMVEAAGSGHVKVGGQDCHVAASGAHTGDISAPMLADLGAQYVIVGHSERRAAYHETDELVRDKARAAVAAGLVPIVCVGETEEERLAGQALDVVARQLAGSVPDEASANPLVVAYEPVWAIGTGRTPTTEDIAEMHRHMRQLLAERFGTAGEGMPLLYGGSMKPSNASEILAVDDVNGGLVGGASLKAADFFAIIRSA